MFTTNLREDHITIRRLRNIAKRCSDLLYEGEEIPYDDIKELITVIEEFIDRCHHGKEECSFFPTFTDELKKEIDALLVEHEFGRRVVNMVARALDEWLEGKEIEPVARLLNAYVTFLDLHMEREEKFFDLIDKHYNIDNISNKERFEQLTEKMNRISDKITRLESKTWYKGSN